MAIGSPQWMYNAGGYQIDNSLRFNDGDSAHLTFTPPSTGNRKRWTFSCWAKRGVITTSQSIAGAYESGSLRDVLRFMADGTLSLQVIHSAATVTKTTAAVFRDSSAWYHIVVVWDSANGTAGNRTKMYINGILQTLTGTDAAVNVDSSFNNDTNHYLGARSSSNANAAVFFDGYMAEVNFIDGVVKAPSDFGEYDKYGGWTPVKYVGAYGDEGWYLDFKSSGVGTAGVATVGADRSGNTNHWTSSALAVTDQMLDTPTNNFATLNPLHNGDTGTLSEGNLKLTTGSGTTEGHYSTIAVQSGKWYAEFLVGTAGTQNMFGIASNVYNNAAGGFRDGTQYSYALGQGAIWANGGESSSLTTTFAVGDIFSVAMDLDNNDWYVARNNTYYNSGNGIGIEANNTYHFSWTFDHDGAAGVSTVNFGQDSSFAAVKTAQGNQDGNGVGDFFYAPPAGFLALCTKNLPEPAVIPSEYFNTVLYTGSGNAQSITGLGLTPDMTWIKSRSNTTSHVIHDNVRSGNGTAYLIPNTDNVELTAANGFVSLDTDGFSLNNVGSGGEVNSSDRTYVAWNWKANGAGAANNTGSINTTKTSANVEAGFSIMTYTGDGGGVKTIGHGLSKAPEMWAAKARTDVSDNQWFVCHKGFASDYATDFIHFDTSGAKQDSGARWGDTVPTTSVISIGGASVNVNNGQYVMYAWHSVDGYSKVGSYTGNGNADGTFVYTGFRPAFILCKQVAGGQAWQMHDTARDTHNLATKVIFTDSNAAEQNSANNGACDILSNGFKWRMADADQNGNGSKYIYLAFAETPFKHSNAR